MALAWPLLLLRRNPRRFAIWSGRLGHYRPHCTSRRLCHRRTVWHYRLWLPLFHAPCGGRGPLNRLDQNAPGGVALDTPSDFRSLPLPWSSSGNAGGLDSCSAASASQATSAFILWNTRESSGTGQWSRVVNLSFLALALVTPMAVARLLRDAPWWRTALVAFLLPVALPTHALRNQRPASSRSP